MACCDCRREMNAAPGHFCPQYGHRLSKSTASSVQADALARMTNPSEGSGDVQQVLAHPVYASPPAPQMPQPQPTVVYYQQGGRPITAPRPTDREDEQGLEGPEGVVDAAPARRHVRVCALQRDVGREHRATRGLAVRGRLRRRLGMVRHRRGGGVVGSRVRTAPIPALNPGTRPRRSGTRGKRTWELFTD